MCSPTFPPSWMRFSTVGNHFRRRVFDFRLLNTFCRDAKCFEKDIEKEFAIDYQKHVAN